MPLRTRLILAFVILIVSSASATILIGNTVFGRKFDEVAADLVALYARQASHVLDSRLEDMRQVAYRIAAQYALDPGFLSSPDISTADVPLDFVLITNPVPQSVLVRFADSSRSGGSRVVLPALEPPGAADLIHGPLAPLLVKVQESNAAVAGIAAVKGGEIAGLIGGTGLRMVLLAVAAAPSVRAGGPGVLIGRVLNDRTDLLERVRGLIPGGRKDRLLVSLFLGDKRIASLRGEKAIDPESESGMAQAVVEGGDLQAGIARVFDRNFFAAYIPIKDMSGNAVAMIGIGSSEDAVAEVRGRTILLFSSLIAGGMVFGFIMTFMFSSWLVSPISHLAEGMSRVAEGDLSYKVRIESADELGKLAGAFNQMVRAVKESDVKLREMTESRLTQVEKQISIGRLAAGVAHEINNPLTAILSLTSLALKKMPAGDPRREDLEIVVSETSRCREIVRNLLDFARERPMEKSRVDVNAVLRDTLPLAKKYESLARVKVDLQLFDAPLVVSADAKLLQQVFMNLLLNAGEATESGGSVRVETDEDSSGHFAQVKVVDRGKGIPKEHLDRVFEPFFTTKAAGKGTGLGLSVSLGIIRKHDGTIEIDSAEGQGTVVTVLLPRVKEAAQ